MRRQRERAYDAQQDHAHIWPSLSELPLRRPPQNSPEGDEEKSAGDQTGRSLVQKRNQSGGSIGVVNDVSAEEYGIEDASKRSTRDQSRAEEGSGSDF